MPEVQHVPNIIHNFLLKSASPPVVSMLLMTFFFNDLNKKPWSHLYLLVLLTSNVHMITPSSEIYILVKSVCIFSSINEVVR